MTTPQTFYIKKDDTGPTIREYLRDSEGAVMDLTGASVEFHMNLASDGSSKVNTGATIDDAGSGLVSYSWIAANTDTAGIYRREWQVTLASGQIVTVPNNEAGYPVIITSDQAD